MSAEDLPLPRPPRNNNPDTISYIDADGEYEYYEMKDGNLIIGATGDAPALGSLTAGSGIAITNGPGTITIAATGGTSTTVAGTVDQVLANGTTGTPQTGAVTLTLPQSIGTASTPQFNSLGLGTAAGATKGRIELAGSSSGVITLAPGATPSTYTFTLPSSGGTSGYGLSTNGSGTTSWSPFQPIVGMQYYAHRGAGGAGGGTGTSNTWVTRTLDTAMSGTLDGVSTSIASNQVTVQAGTYYIIASGPAQNAGSHLCRIYNVTDATVLVEGTMEYSGASSTASQTRSFAEAYVVIASPKTYRVDHQVGITGSLGANRSGGMTNTYAIFTMFTIWKYA